MTTNTPLLSPIEWAGAVTAINAAVLSWFTYRNRDRGTTITAEVAFRDDLVAELAAERVLRAEAERSRDDWRERYYTMMETVSDLRIKLGEVEAELRKVETELRHIREDNLPTRSTP